MAYYGLPTARRAESQCGLCKLMLADRPAPSGGLGSLRGCLASSIQNRIV